MNEKPVKPVLVRYFEAAAVVVGLDKPGRHRLELIFENGQLVQWYSHAERRGRGTLSEFDTQASSLLGELADLG